MRGYKKIWALLLAVAMLAGLSACGGKGDDAGTPQGANPIETTAPGGAGQDGQGDDAASGSEGQNAEKTDTAGADGAERGYTVALPDGTSIAFEKAPERVVSVGPNITEILFKLGAGDKVVGRTDYCDEPEQVKEIPSIGTIYSPDIEKIIELQPDLVIGSAHFGGEAKERLEEVGIRSVVLFDSESMDGVYNTIRTAGELVGKAQEGKALADETKKRIDDTIAKYSGEEYAGAEAPTVYYVVGYGEGGDWTAGGNTFIGQMISQAGGKNIAQEVEGWQIDHEVLIEADPEIIIVRLGEAESFCAAPGYQELSAVKNGKVYEYDTDHLLDRQGYRNADIFIEFAKLFHGEAE